MSKVHCAGLGLRPFRLSDLFFPIHWEGRYDCTCASLHLQGQMNLSIHHASINNVSYVNEHGITDLSIYPLAQGICDILLLLLGTLNDSEVGTRFLGRLHI